MVNPLKSLFNSFLPIVIFCSNTTFPQNYFPLEVGNRWDYFVEGHVSGGHTFYDTLSIEIEGKHTLVNGMEYFLYSGSFPFWYSLYPKYVREDNNKIYFFDEEDSIDCFAYRFDLPVDSIYNDCKGRQSYILGIDSSITLGYPDIHQIQFPNGDFSYNFGIYHFFKPGLVEFDYVLKGCIISGVTYGNLLVSVGKDIHPPNKFTLSQNYPNPFNPTTKIKFTIPTSPLNPSPYQGEGQRERLITLKIYDVLGNEVTTLVNKEKPAESYEVEFDGAILTSGIY
ncbi:MAG: hypothetical protein DRQ13_13010, partial [Ignavibacteriae bacterium]